MNRLLRRSERPFKLARPFPHAHFPSLSYQDNSFPPRKLESPPPMIKNFLTPHISRRFLFPQVVQKEGLRSPYPHPPVFLSQPLPPNNLSTFYGRTYRALNGAFRKPPPMGVFLLFFRVLFPLGGKACLSPSPFLSLCLFFLFSSVPYLKAAFFPETAIAFPAFLFFALFRSSDHLKRSQEDFASPLPENPPLLQFLVNMKIAPSLLKELCPF